MAPIRESQNQPENLTHQISSFIKLFSGICCLLLTLSSPDAAAISKNQQAAAFQINAGLNDAWVNVDAPLQGLFVTMFPDLGLVFVAWFTFDSEIPIMPAPAAFGAGDQRWVTALGTIDGNKVSLKAELTTGGSFNSSDPTPVQDTDYGTIDLEFSSCTEGIVTH